MWRPRLKNGWYILNYHDVNWEESPFLNRIGGNFPPDIFEEHVRHLAGVGELVAVNEGYDALQSGSIDGPLISFWFDDGYAGVRRYASDVLRRFGTTAAMSLNSAFTLREDLFWRAKLSFLLSIDQGRVLRTRLKPFGYRFGGSIKSFTLDSFCSEIVTVIDDLYRECSSEALRTDAFRIFDSEAGLRELHDSGWLLTNHSTHHYPIGEDAGRNFLQDEFLHCQQALSDRLPIDERFLVLPFDRASKRCADLASRIGETFPGKHLVLVGDRLNTTPGVEIHRFGVPQLTGRDFVKYLSRVAN